MVSIAGFWYIWQAYLVGGLLISFYHRCDHLIILFSLINILPPYQFPTKSDFVPTTIVQDIVNNVGGFGRWQRSSIKRHLFFIFAGLRIKVQINYWKLFWWYRNCKKLVNRINIPRKCTLWIFLLSRPVLRNLELVAWSIPCGAEGVVGE